MPQQRENSICINAPFAAGLDAEKNQTFLLVLSRDQAGSPLQTACLVSRKATLRCSNKSVLPDSRTGLRHQTDTGLKFTAASQECLLAADFITRCRPSLAAAVGLT